MAKTLFERIWERHLVAEPEGEPAVLFVDLHLIHEVTSPQAFDGLRLAGRQVRRPDLSLATMDHNVPTEEGPVTDPLAKAQLDALSKNCARVRRAALRDRKRPRGDRPRDRPGARPDAARNDDRLRRQSHLHARRVRRARVRRRHLRGRARARDAVPAAATAALDARPLRRRPASERDGEGHDPRRDRQARGRRRRRARARVHRAGDPRPLDGEPDDDLQHVDRGRRAGGIDRARRHHVRLSRGPARSADRLRVGAGARRLARARVRSRRHLRQRVRDRCRGARAAGHVGDEPGDGRLRHRPRPGSRRLHRSRPAAGGRAGAHLHGPRAGHGDAGHLGRPGLHRLVHERPDRGSARGGGRGRRQAGPPKRPRPRRAGLGDDQAARRGRGARPDLRRRRLRVAAGGVLDVPRHESRRARRRRALRLDLEPQLRGPAGARRPHAPGQPAARRRDGDRGPLRRPARAGDAA